MGADGYVPIPRRMRTKLLRVYKPPGRGVAGAEFNVEMWRGSTLVWETGEAGGVLRMLTCDRSRAPRCPRPVTRRMESGAGNRVRSSRTI